MAQSDEADLPTPSEILSMRLSTVAEPSQTHGLVDIANYLCPLIFVLDKEKMKNLSEYLFNKGMHVTAR
ncbi:hypothetical protein HAX54_037531, partial [Datura stramonium]|nr:hypothetical protein [Datura stramonium]